MKLSSGPESAAPRRGRRIVLALLILLLIALPLYLWPLRGGGSGLPGAAALSRVPLDPRDAAAVAHLPADVWEGLMGGSSAPHGAPPPGGSGNLTRIGPLDDSAAGPFDIGTGGGSLPPRYDTLSRGHEITAFLGDGLDPSSGQAGGADDSLPAPVQFLAGPTSGENAGAGSGWGGGGYGGFPGNLGPFAGGGPGGPGGPSGTTPTFFPDPGDPSVPAPTPEPGTILLVGSNLALFGAAAWRRLRRREETGR